MAQVLSSSQRSLSPPPPPLRPPRAQSDQNRAKADQIIYHFYAKTSAILIQSRITHLDDSIPLPSRRPSPAHPTAKKLNKWFNLESEETDLFRTELKTWRSVAALLDPTTSSSTSLSSPPPTQLVPPLVLDIILDTSDMTPTQVLVLSDQRGRRARVDIGGGPGIASQPTPTGLRSPQAPKRSNLILETWTLSLDPTVPHQSPELPSLYKHAIVLFRSLYTLARTLPAWGLYRRLTRGRGAGAGGNGRRGLHIGCRMSSHSATTGEEGERVEGEIGLTVPITEKVNEPVTETIQFAPVVTPIGSLRLSCTYRLNTDFAVEDIETLLSSRFIDEDFFKPTVARYQQDNSPGRPESLPTRGIMPINPPVRSSTNIPIASYGSLSSRHPVVAQPLPFAALPIPVDASRAPLPEERPPLVGSAPSYSDTSRFGGSYGAGVEPAFVSLERARIAGLNIGSSVQRASPAQGIRRQSFTSGSPSSSSPIFRAGSYLGSPQISTSGPTSNIHRSSSSPSSYPYGGEPSSSLRTSSLPYQQPLPQTQQPTGQSSLSFTSRSPLSPPVQQSNLASGAPRPSLYPSSSSPGSGSSPQAMPIMRQYSSSFAGGSRPSSRSFGQGSSLGSQSGGDGSPNIVSGSESLGRKVGRLTFDGRASSFTRIQQSAEESTMERRTAAEDSEEINEFLGMIDSRPDLLRGGSSTSGVGGGVEGGGGSMILSKIQAEEELKRFGSVYGSSPSNLDLNDGSGMSGGRRSSLRRRPSKLSIEEEEPPFAGTMDGEAKSRNRSSPSSFPLRTSYAASRTNSPQPPSTISRFYTPTSPSASSNSSPVPTNLAFPQYIPRARARSGGSTGSGGGHGGGEGNNVITHGFNVQNLPGGGEGEDVLPSPASASAASIISEGGEGMSSIERGCEEEAVGRLELSEDCEEDDAVLQTAQNSPDIITIPLSTTHPSSTSSNAIVGPPTILGELQRGRRHFSSLPTSAPSPSLSPSTSRTRDTTPAGGFVVERTISAGPILPEFQFRRGGLGGRNMGFFNYSGAMGGGMGSGREDVEEERRYSD